MRRRKTQLRKQDFSWYSRSERQSVSDEITEVYLELSSHCNLSCAACMRSSIRGFKPAFFPTDMARPLVSMLGELPSLERVTLLGFGEALLHPDFREIAEILRELTVKIVLATNAILLSWETSDFLIELPIDEIYTSWDDAIGYTSPEHRSGADFSLFERNVSYLANRRARQSHHTRIGMEVVATSDNLPVIRDIVSFGSGLALDSILISNLMPYSRRHCGKVLYSFYDKPKQLIGKSLYRKQRRSEAIRIANQDADCPRKCPFMEKGTLFVSSSGEVAPCPTLAYTHRAYYNGLERIVRKHPVGNLAEQSLAAMWNNAPFAWFRSQFETYNFPDCSFCPDPHKCWHREHDDEDCHGNPAPCGECLWAKDIIICP